MNLREPSQLTEAIHWQAFPRWGRSVNVGMSDISPEQAGIDGTGLTDNQVAIVAIGVVVSKDVPPTLTDISASDLKVFIPVP